MRIEILTNTNILDVEADAIINSVGICGGLAGAVCTSILKACKDSYQQLAFDILDNLKDEQYGDYWISKTAEDGKNNANVKSKYIIHYITPRFDLDFKQNGLIDTFNKIIKIANKHKELDIKRIGIPAIGTGYNKYSNEAFWKAVEDFKDEIELNRQKSTYYKDLTLIFVDYGKHNNDPEDDHEIIEKTRNEISFIDIKGKRRTIKTSTLVTSNVYKLTKLYQLFKVDKAFMFSFPYEKPIDYLRDYCGCTGNDKELLKYLVGDKNYQMTHQEFYNLKKKNNFDIEQISKIADCLAPFSRDNFIQLLFVNGITIAPNGKGIDDKVLDFWLEHEMISYKGQLYQYYKENQ